MRGLLVGCTLLSGSALLAITGAALLAHDFSGAGLAAPDGPAGAPVAVTAASSTFVCSLSNSDATRSLVQGADGGLSVVVGGHTYWLFGDTLLLPESGKQIEQNAIGDSNGTPESGCPSLSYYAPSGAAAPFIEKDGALTVWPRGAMATGDHTLDVYATYVYGSGPYAYWIGEIGLLRLDPSTMRADVLNRTLWSNASGFSDQVIGVQPVDSDSAGHLRLLLQTSHGDELLARVLPSEAAQPASYEYWTGASWSSIPGDATPLWSHVQSTDPVAGLASFDSGVSVAWNEFLHQYVAVENIGVDKIGARTADRLEGPWGPPVAWIDCTTIAAPAVPVCYSPFQHPELASDGGRTLFVTFTRLATYDVVGYRIALDHGLTTNAEAP